MIKFKVDSLDLIRLAATLEQSYLLHHQGRVFILLAGGIREVIVVYAEMKPEGSFVKFDYLKNEAKWVDRIKKTSDVVYIPVITVDHIEGIKI